MASQVEPRLVHMKVKPHIQTSDFDILHHCWKLQVSGAQLASLEAMLWEQVPLQEVPHRLKI